MKNIIQSQTNRKKLKGFELLKHDDEEWRNYVIREWKNDVKNMSYCYHSTMLPFKFISQ